MTLDRVLAAIQRSSHLSTYQMHVAFPECKSPSSIPERKWEKCVTAYETWRIILFSDKLAYRLDMPMEKLEGYLQDAIDAIAKNEF